MSVCICIHSFDKLHAIKQRDVWLSVLCTLQIVMWDIAEYEDRFQFNKPLKASDTKGNMAAQVGSGY